MCFSASASLITGTALSTVGVAAVAKTKERAAIPFAMIPLLFGIQQMIEGGVWLSFRYDAQSFNRDLTYVYALFAFVVWPIFIPFSVGLLETIQWRRRLMYLFQAMGVTVGLYLLYSHTLSPVVSQIVKQSIAYGNSHFFGLWVIAFYFVATIGSCVVSSERMIILFGVLAFLFALTAYFVYTKTFVSVWCFFAAILSVIIYLSVRERDVRRAEAR